jgi:hypothetical protein
MLIGKGFLLWGTTDLVSCHWCKNQLHTISLNKTGTKINSTPSLQTRLKYYKDLPLCMCCGVCYTKTVCSCQPANSNIDPLL